WKIKARVTSKSDIRRWSNARGEGTLFSIDLLDSAGGEIRATFFKDACEKWFPQLEEQKVYTFSGGRLKVGDRKYSTMRNEYELTFDANSEIQHCADDNDIKTMNYNFMKISDLPQVEANATVDLLAIVRSAGECSELISQKMGGKTLHKRELVLYDDSGFDVRLTLWGDRAQADTPWNDGPIVAFKGLGVSEYGGRTL
ncbi:RPA1C, partial [Symbiodinium microadriaticum]